MKSTKAMRDRIRELMPKAWDDYDRAVDCVLEDLETSLVRIEALEAALREIAKDDDGPVTMAKIARAALSAQTGANMTHPQSSPGCARLSEQQRKLDASVTAEQAAINVRREREAMANRGKPHPQPDGFINDYD